MVWRDAAFEIGQFSTERGIVVVQLQAELPRAVDVGVVDLDLVGLGMGARDEEPCERDDGDVSQRPRAATRKDPTGVNGWCPGLSVAGGPTPRRGSFFFRGRPEA